MSSRQRFKIALVGNPNSGKSSLFNYLTGLNQKIGNFPGVTVEKRSGFCLLPNGENSEIIDLPGIYSIYPRSMDERIVAQILLDQKSPLCPDLVVVIADATNLNRGLLLLSQIIDLGLPTILVLNMMDQVAKAGIHYNLRALSTKLGIPVIPIVARNGIGVNELKRSLSEKVYPAKEPIFPVWKETVSAVREVREKLQVDNDYEAYLFLEQPQSVSFLSSDEQATLEAIRKNHDFFPGKFQGAEIVQRYAYIQDLLDEVLLKPANNTWKKYSQKIDKLVTHKIWGYAIFLTILFLLFQSIFAWATVPMDLIDSFFAMLSQSLSIQLPKGPVNALLTEGLIPGIGGIVIFVPQIAILFGFISILEESGYMARVVFLMDKMMRRFGLNGKSIVPLISGVACAIPAIMATRTIDNWKERLITILVTPLMSCSARLPVFTILIALIVPNQKALGFFNLQGLALMALYMIGFGAAILSALAMQYLIKIKERSFLIMELPTYRWPKWSNVGLTIIEKTKAFVFEAGKIIIAISIILWVLASYGPGDHIQNAREMVLQESPGLQQTPAILENRIAAYQLEHSYAGIIGKGIEPVIKPLGYDWKIGIALITSFAAREVFVGTMATIYSIGSADESEASTIKERMREEINPDTGEKRFTPAVGLSLLLFYTFAMQCMSTIAIVYKETNGWKWPLIQLVYMTMLAYFSALLTYQLLS